MGTRRSDPTRITLVEGGPMLVEGPVEVVQADGELVASDRPLVALCTCRRSDRLPFCDTSHRRRLRRGDGQASGSSNDD